MHRFQQVREILDNSVGGAATPVAGPHRAFWRIRLHSPVQRLALRDAVVTRCKSGEPGGSPEEPSGGPCPPVC